MKSSMLPTVKNGLISSMRDSMWPLKTKFYTHESLGKFQPISGNRYQ